MNVSSETILVLNLEYSLVFFCTESLYVFPCQWNYRPDHCIYGSNCKEAEEEGIFILHGNRGVYHDDKQPTFRAVYEAIKNVSMSSILLRTKLFYMYFMQCCVCFLGLVDTSFATKCFFSLKYFFKHFTILWFTVWIEFQLVHLVINII